MRQNTSIVNFSRYFGCFFIFIVFFYFQATAVPIITSTSSPVAGDTIICVAADTTGYNPGSAGANVTWDFTALSVTAQDTTYYIPPSATPFASFYPNANLASRDTSAHFLFNCGYYFYASSSSSLNVAGWVIENGGDTSTFYNGKTELFLKYPLAYLDSCFDTSYAYQRINTPGYYKHRYLRDKSVVDGWGKLKLPGVVFDTALRVKYIQIMIDSAFLSADNSFVQAESAITITSYHWLAHNLRPWLLEMSDISGLSGGNMRDISITKNSIAAAVSGISNQPGNERIRGGNVPNIRVLSSTIGIYSKTPLQDGMFTFYNAQGAVIQKTAGLNGSRFFINVRQGLHGAYFYRLSGKNIGTVSGKIFLL